MILSNIIIDKTKYNTNIKDIIKAFNQNNTKEIIINTIDKEIFLIGNKNINYKYTDYKIFDNIYLPEIINFYLINNIVKIEKEYLKNNNYIYSINNNIHLIYKDKEQLSNIKSYIKTINNRNNIKLELKNNITLENDVIESNRKEKIYSYGYINILLISLLIAVSTIIFCLTKLH
ncbi:MAG: hypothetical protein IJI49_02100 [Bacilli bacterium]|nr:hypothetical protein [Bacilli bacterium]